MLELDGLTKRYGDAPVFTDVHLRAVPGEVVALLGESGVGKSTLLNCIAGLDRPDAGTVRLGGTEVTALDEHGQALFRRAHVGFVFQAFHLLPHLSVGHNVGLPLRLLGTPDEARVQSLLDAVGLAGFADRLPRTLSGGQLQRVAIARALVHRPALVLADEPTGNLDPATAAPVLDLLLDQVRAQPAIGLLVTHSPAAAARCDRVLTLTPSGLRAP
ncbi:ABC transporter ATP-binding protein [Aquabacterium sp. J223]|uniref:ABC transporter ATP-binding protein n=1 Tax=Aquabacterium sp. J223 TaxID=2898431 RepID=UPI0021ADAD72|nr:ABC transporter ATP-binding protein [Aquabacterium sp. J223]UUX94845.1 ABC transporter ATP-binding protein [Aquabacterium sp. J223]